MGRGIFCTNFINYIGNPKARGCSERTLRDDHFYKGTFSITDQMEDSDMVKIISWQNFRERTVIF